MYHCLYEEVNERSPALLKKMLSAVKKSDEAISLFTQKSFYDYRFTHSVMGLLRHFVPRSLSRIFTTGLYSLLAKTEAKVQLLKKFSRFKNG